MISENEMAFFSATLSPKPLLMLLVILAPVFHFGLNKLPQFALVP